MGEAEPLAVYVHWPFCRSKCPYCDFNSHVRDGVDAARWTKALLADLETALRRVCAWRDAPAADDGGTR